MSTLEYSQDTVIKIPTYKEVHRCNVCKHFTNSMFLIRNHVKRHLLPRKTFNCGESAPETYHCKDCDFKTDLTIFFKKHIQQIHLLTSENGEEPQSVEYALQSFICRSCTLETYSSLQWLKHQQVGCSSIKEMQHEEADGQKLPCKGSQVCQHCSIINNMDLNADVKSAHSEDSYECYHCGFKTSDKCFLKTKKEENVKIHNIKVAEKNLWFRCDECPYKTKIKDNLTAHVTSEHSEWTHTNLIHCDKCSYKTKTKGNLNSHNINKHLAFEDVKWFQCDKCPHKTKTKNHLTVHVTRKHSEWTCTTNLFCCDKCSFKTKTKDSLKQHNINKHLSFEDVKNFQCDKCSYRTKVKGTLKMHNIRNHLTSEEIQWFQCNKCPYKAKLRNVLIRHNALTHHDSKHLPHEEIKWFQCDNCSYRTTKKDLLRKHNRSKHLPHEEIKWFQCDNCSFKTKDRKTLKRHNIRKHLASEEVQWFQCDKCPYKAKIREDLRRHQTRKHRENIIKQNRKPYSASKETQ